MGLFDREREPSARPKYDFASLLLAAEKTSPGSKGLRAAIAKPLEFFLAQVRSANSRVVTTAIDCDKFITKTDHMIREAEATLAGLREGQVTEGTRLQATLQREERGRRKMQWLLLRALSEQGAFEGLKSLDECLQSTEFDNDEDVNTNGKTGNGPNAKPPA